MQQPDGRESTETPKGLNIVSNPKIQFSDYSFGANHVLNLI